MNKAVIQGCLASMAIYGISVAALDPGKLLSQYIFDRWGLEDSLPQNSVQAIIQSSDGYLWLGTQEGLARFDGKVFKVYDKNSVAAMSDHYINALTEDGTGRLWIGTRNGIYSYSAGQFTTYEGRENAPRGKIHALVVKPDGGLWIGGESGLYLFHENRFTEIRRSSPRAMPAVRSLLTESNGSLWIGTVYGLFYLPDPEQSEGSMEPYLNERSVRALCKDSHGVIWVGTESGLFKLNGQEPPELIQSDGLPATQVLALAEDHDGVLWIGTALGPVRKSGDIFSNDAGAGSPHSSMVLSMFSGREGGLWVGTYTDGLHRYRDGLFTCIGPPEGLPYKVVRCVIRDSRGAYWLGTEKGLSRYMNGVVQTFSENDGLPKGTINCLMEDKQGNIWAGTRYKGVARFDGASWTIFDQKDGLIDDTIRTIYQTKDDTVWIGSTHAGLQPFRNGRFEQPHKGLPSKLIYSVFEDRDGAIWAGTEGDGLSILHDGRTRVITTHDGLAGNTVYNFYQDAHGDIWIGTDGGLTRYRQGVFNKLRLDNPLFNGVIYTILEDDDGQLWMSCNKGVFSVAKEALNQFLSGQIDDPLVSQYGIHDGMRSRECNFGGASSGFRQEDGTLVFPTLKGIATIQPLAKRTNIHPPPVHIQSVLANDLPVEADADIRFVRGQGKIRFEYTALSFPAWSNVMFRYRLVGFENKWVEAGTRREAFFTNLAPGDYEFRVIACNNDGIWNPAGDTFHFTILPSIYQMGWFRALIVISGLLFVFLVYTWRVRTLVRRKRKLQTLVAQRTEALVDANRELVTAQEKLVSAAHQAGMADVATNVLHNIGNALNSVNVTSMLIEKAVHDQKVDFFCRLVDLLETNKQDLVRFLEEDDRGKSVLPALRKVADSWTRGQTKLVREISTLENQILRINDIIRAQQSYAEHSGQFNEATDVGQLVMEILETRFSHLGPIGVKIQTTFEDTPLVNVQKSKLAQVILHVLNNAVEAVKHQDDPERRGILIRGSVANDNTVRITVRDSGAGIDAESIDRIFFHGFTTKPGSDGFGLHFCANAMREMQGSIRAFSDGEDKGALFQLDIPIVPIPH